MPTSGKYTDEEVRTILDRALRSEPDRGMSHEELVAIASEVGVSREAIDAAARHVHVEGTNERGRQQVRRRRRRHLASHAVTFAIVNAFLFAINYLTSPGQWWVLFPVFAWGLALVFHARFALSHEVSAKAILREQRRAAREQRHDELSERMEPATLGKVSFHAADAPRPRIESTPVAPEPNAEVELQAELGAVTPEVARRRE